MANVRLIARLDLKMNFLIKGVQLEGWRKVGDPSEFARRYYQGGADELLYMDVVASLYDRNNLDNIVRRAAEEIFIPITVGGGIRRLEDVKALLAVGADKVAINTAATRDPELLRRISDTYGSQATVLSIEAKRLPQGGWEAMTDNGRNHTERDPVRWAAEAQALGAGEILVTSIDRDGTEKGMDIELIRAITREVDIPVIAAGGVGRPEHVLEALKIGGAGAVAMAKALHYNKIGLPALRERLAAEGVSVRALEEA
jgi:imidazole glycerol-phosphate synthase subunit HisF